MVEPTLARLKMWVWEYEYPDSRHYPGLHLTADRASCRALSEYLSSLNTPEEVFTRTIPLHQLRSEDAALISGSLRYHSFVRLKFFLSPSREDLEQFSIRAEGDAAFFEWAAGSLRLFLEGIGSIERGEGDYSIKPDLKSGRDAGQRDRESQPLWFWPCFGHLSDGV